MATAAVSATRSIEPDEPLHAGADLPTDTRRDPLTALFAVDAHLEVEATWGIYQRTVAACEIPTGPGPSS